MVIQFSLKHIFQFCSSDHKIFFLNLLIAAWPISQAKQSAGFRIMLNIYEPERLKGI